MRTPFIKASSLIFNFKIQKAQVQSIQPQTDPSPKNSGPTHLYFSIDSFTISSAIKTCLTQIFDELDLRPLDFEDVVKVFVGAVLRRQLRVVDRVGRRRYARSWQ
jgi:hypothetical protein